MHAFTFLQRLGCGFRGVARLENCKMMSTVRASSWRDLSTNEMSYGSQRKIAAFLDSSHTLNWKDLLSMMPEYGYRNNFNFKNMMIFSVLYRCSSYPSRRLEERVPQYLY